MTGYCGSEEQPVFLQEKHARANLLPLPEGKYLARGEKALWAAVITQALMDALHKPTNAETRYYKHEAATWLTEGSRNFHTVCEHAGFDPGYIRRMAKRALSSKRKWRADPGDGPRYRERREHRRRMKYGMTRLPDDPMTRNSGHPVTGHRVIFSQEA